MYSSNSVTPLYERLICSNVLVHVSLDLIKAFLLQCQRKALSQHTLQAYKRDLAKLHAYATRNQISLIEITAADLRSWIDALQTDGLSAASRKRHLAAAKVFYKWLEADGQIVASPLTKLNLTIKQPRRLPRNISRTHLRVMFTALNAVDVSSRFEDHTLRLSLELLIVTGVRISELCRIELNDMDTTAGTIRIMGKGARERTVFVLDERLKAMIAAYCNLRLPRAVVTNQLLITKRGEAARPDYIRRLLRAFTDNLGLPGPMTPHMFRHSAATLLLENGVDMRFVQRLLGHASISTTELYTHVSDSGLKDAIQKGGIRKTL